MRTLSLLFRAHSFVPLRTHVAAPKAPHLRSFSTTAAVRIAIDDMAPVNTTDRLSALRRLMQKHGVDIYSMDPIHE